MSGAERHSDVDIMSIATRLAHEHDNTFHISRYTITRARYSWERDMSTGAIINLLHEWLGQCEAELLQIVDNLVPTFFSKLRIKTCLFFHTSAPPSFQTFDMSSSTMTLVLPDVPDEVLLPSDSDHLIEILRIQHRA